MAREYHDGSMIGPYEGRQYTPTKAQRILLQHLVDKHTQQGLAEKVGYSAKTIRRLCNEGGSTSINVWEDICDEYPMLREAAEITIEDATRKVLEEANSNLQRLLREAMRLADLPVDDAQRP